MAEAVPRARPDGCGRPARKDFLVLALVFGLSEALALSQPINDRFDDRTVLQGLPLETTGTNVGATDEPEDPPEVTANGGGTVWWSWTAPTSGRVVVSTAGSQFDTLLGVYTGGALAELTLVASNDDEDLLGGVFTSRVTFFARAGATYALVVSGLRGAETQFDAGAIRLSIAPAPAAPAPAWSATDLDGQLLQSSDLLGKVVLLDFWATWCAPCRLEIPIFIDLQDRYRAAGLVVVGVSVDTAGPDVVRAFMRELGMNYPVILTWPQLEQDFGGIPSLPTAFLVDREGNLAGRHVGVGDREFWEREISGLLEAGTLAPHLQIRAREKRIILNWPTTPAGFLVEETDDLASGRWSRQLDPPELVEGQNALSLPAAFPRRFFRLVRP